MALYRDQVVRVSTRMIRSQFAPRRWRSMTSVRVEHGGITSDVHLIEQPNANLKGARTRKMLECPRCRRPVHVIGLVVEGERLGEAWGCRACCGGWRSRRGSA